MIKKYETGIVLEMKRAQIFEPGLHNFGFFIKTQAWALNLLLLFWAFKVTGTFRPKTNSTILFAGSDFKLFWADSSFKPEAWACWAVHYLAPKGLIWAF